MSSLMKQNNALLQGDEQVPDSDVKVGNPSTVSIIGHIASRDMSSHEAWSYAMLGCCRVLVSPLHRTNDTHGDCLTVFWLTLLCCLLVCRADFCILSLLRLGRLGRLTHRKCGRWHVPASGFPAFGESLPRGRLRWRMVCLRRSSDDASLGIALWFPCPTSIARLLYLYNQGLTRVCIHGTLGVDWRWI